MPCWYYEKKDLRVTPSCKDGINADIEARYRREGARFIIDTGTKMGLYPFCAELPLFFVKQSIVLYIYTQGNNVFTTCLKAIF